MLGEQILILTYEPPHSVFSRDVSVVAKKTQPPSMSPLFAINLLIHVVSYLHLVHSDTINQYDGDNETIWQSTSSFIPQKESTYGYIKIGQTMSMEFTMTWNGRSNPNVQQYEQFFSIDTALYPTANTVSETYYPSLYLQASRDYLAISIFEKIFHLNELQLISGGAYHVIISLNSTQFIISINNQLMIRNSSNNLYKNDYIKEKAKIWFTSNDNEQFIGNATFTNIVLKSSIFTKITDEATEADDDGGKGDFYWIIFVLILLVIISMIIFCCYKSKQIRKELIAGSDIEKQTNFAIINANEKYRANMSNYDGVKNTPNKKSQSFESVNIKTGSDGQLTPKSNENGTDSEEPIPSNPLNTDTNLHQGTHIQIGDKSPSNNTSNNALHYNTGRRSSNLSINSHHSALSNNSLQPKPKMYPTESMREYLGNAMKNAAFTNYNSLQHQQQNKRVHKKKRRKRKKKNQFMVNSRSPTMSAIEDNDDGTNAPIIKGNSLAKPGMNPKRMLSNATSTDEIFGSPVPTENGDDIASNDAMTNSDDDAVTADGDLHGMTGGGPPRYTEDITLQISGERENSPDLSEYKWISDALRKIVNDTKHDLYLKNFRDQMITDKRIKLLWDEDLQLLIPEMGPRREFQNLLNLKGRKPKKSDKKKIKNENKEDSEVVYKDDIEDGYHHNKQQSFVD